MRIEGKKVMRWLSLLVICFVVFSGIQGCVVVVADEDVAQEIKVERDRSRLAREIQKDIDYDELLEYSKVDVHESDGVVTLSGDVENLVALQRAVDVALSRPGVKEIRLRLDLNNR